MNLLGYLSQLVRDPARRLGEHIAAERGPSTNAVGVGGLYDKPLIGLYNPRLSRTRPRPWS